MALFLVHLDVLVAPEPDKILRKMLTPTIALLSRDTFTQVGEENKWGKDKVG